MNAYEKVLAFIRKFPGQSGVAIAAGVGLHVSDVYPLLKAMQENDDIQKQGATNNARFYA
jgi:DNA-binding IclR family transcriptional regulator